MWLLELRPGSFDLLLSTLRELPSPVYRGEGLWLQRFHISQSDSILHVPGTVALSVLAFTSVGEDNKWDHFAGV